MVVMHRSGINIEVVYTSAAATSKASLYSVLVDQQHQHLAGVQPPRLLNFTTNLLMLIMILQKMF